MAAGKPLSARQKRRIAAVVEQAEERSGIQFVAYVGPAGADTRAAARELLAGVGGGVGAVVVVLVDPEQRRYELLASEGALAHIDRRDLGLAATAMQASCAVGDIAGGVVQAVTQLAESATYVGPDDVHRIRQTAELPDLVEHQSA